MDEFLQFARDGANFMQPYPVVQAVLVILFFLLLAKLADFLFARVCHRLAARTQSRLDDQVVRIMHRPIFATIATIGLVLATYRLQFSAGLQNTTVDILETILIFVWVIACLRLARVLLDAMRRNERHFQFVQPATAPILNNAVAIFLLLAGAYAILVSWDINVTGLVASAGIVGLALSFAAQDTLANLFAGVAILVDQPYKIGDYINLDSGERGQVTNIGLRSTRLLTRDDVEITVPNGVMGSAKISNESGGPHEKYRLRVAVGVAYGSDIDQVIQVLMDCAISHEQVCKNPEPRVRFRVFGESSLNFELLAWIEQPVLRGLVHHELNCVVYKAFADQGIKIPFPQRDLYIKEMPAG